MTCQPYAASDVCTCKSSFSEEKSPRKGLSGLQGGPIALLEKIRRLTKLHRLKRREYLTRCFAIFFPFSFSQLPPGLVSGTHNCILRNQGTTQVHIWQLGLHSGLRGAWTNLGLVTSLCWQSVALEKSKLSDKDIDGFG